MKKNNNESEFADRLLQNDHKLDINLGLKILYTQFIIRN